MNQKQTEQMHNTNTNISPYVHFLSVFFYKNWTSCTYSSDADIQFSSVFNLLFNGFLRKDLLRESWDMILKSEHARVHYWSQISIVHFVQPLTLHRRALVEVATSQQHLFRQKKDQWIAKVDRKMSSWKTVDKEDGLECKSVTECRIEPYRLLFPLVASVYLVDPYPVV